MHTPGPWTFSWEIQPNGCPTVGHKGLMVCMVSHSAKVPAQRDTALANAALISAAPDLLKALEDLLAGYAAYAPNDGWPDKRERQAIEAISKARTGK